MVRKHHWLNGPEFEITLGDREGLSSRHESPWGCEESDFATENKCLTNCDLVSVS